MRLAVLYHRFGPYHVARLRAASAVGDLVALEGSATDRIYAWSRICRFEGLDRRVLFADGDIGDRPLRAIWRRTAEVLAEVEPDVVAVPGWGFTATFGAMDWCLRRGIPVVMMNSSQQRDFPRAWWKERLKSLMVRRCSAAFVAGSRSADYVRALGIPAARIRTGCTVVDNEHFARGAAAARAEAPRLRGELGLPERYLLTSGRFVAKKNFLRLLAAFARVVAAPESAHLHLVILGDGEQRPAIERAIRRHAVAERVRLAGFRQYDELPSFYGLAESFVLVSTSEQWGLVVNEAMAAGLPVVVSENCGCAPDLVEPGRNGFTCYAEDVEDIARALRRIAGAGVDRPSMGLASRDKIRDWSPRSFAEGLWASAEDALAHPETRGPATALGRSLAWWLRHSGQA